jgi:hypothetical protein
MITLAKLGGDSNWDRINRKFNDSEVSIPKLKHFLVNRYQDRKGGFVRIIKNGHRASGSDRAPLAIIELVNNPNDVVYHLAQQQIGIVSKQLAAIETKKYKREPVMLKNLKTGELEEVIKLKERSDITGFEKKRLSRAEFAIHKKLIKYNKSIRTFPEARAADEQSEIDFKALVSTFDKLTTRGDIPPRDRVQDVLPVKSKIKIINRPPKKEESSQIVEIPAEAPKSFKDKFFGRLFK